jgi:hypothetical protein
MKMEQTECSETSEYKIQTPGNYPEENIQHTEHGESLKSRIIQDIFNLKAEQLFLFIICKFFQYIDSKVLQIIEKHLI